MQYSIINFRTVLEHKDKRIDSGHYHPYHLNNLRKYQAHSKPLGRYILHMSGGATPLGAIYPDTGIPFLRVQNIMQNYLSEPNMAYLTKPQHNAILRSELKTNDVLLTITGVSYGKSAVVTSKFNGANINQHSVKMTVNAISPHFLATFLNCKYGYSQSARHIVGDTRPALDYTAINNFFIPNLTNSFQNKIETVCLEVELKNKTEDYFYNQAKNILLSELGLTDWQPKRPIAFIKRYSDIKESRRMDADYFQPRYDEIINTMKSYSKGWDMLGNLTTIKEKDYKPQNNQQYKYIELSNIEENGEITGCMVEKGKDLPSRARRKVFTDDVIVSSIEGSLSSVAIIENKYNQALCSTGFHVISSEFLNSATLFILLKSVIGQLQLKKGCSGTILTAISDSEFNKIILPKIKKATQTKIQQKITESFALRKQSKHLLECAKRAVEIAIEEDEKTALAWLKKETKE